MSGERGEGVVGAFVGEGGEGAVAGGEDGGGRDVAENAGDLFTQAVAAKVSAAYGAGEEEVAADEQRGGVGRAGGADEVGVVRLGVAGGGEGLDGVAGAVHAGAVGEAGGGGDAGAEGGEDGGGSEQPLNFGEAAGVFGLGVGEKNGGEFGDVGGPHAAEEGGAGAGVEEDAFAAAAVGDEVGVGGAETVGGAQGVQAEGEA